MATFAPVYNRDLRRQRPLHLNGKRDGDRAGCLNGEKRRRPIGSRRGHQNHALARSYAVGL